MSAAEALVAARAAGVRVSTDGDDLVLEASAPPPPDVLDLLQRHKADIATLLGSPEPEPSEAPEPMPPQPCLAEPSTTGWEQGDAAQAAMVAGLLIASRRRPPSWADPTALPSRGCFCTCCKGRRWWCEREAPKGWRCRTCHPPDHLPSGVVTEVRT